MLLQVGLLRLQVGDLRLQFVVLVLLVQVRVLHVFFGLQHIVCQVFTDLLGLASQGIVQIFLLGPQGLDLSLVEIEFLMQSLNGLFQSKLRKSLMTWSIPWKVISVGPI